MSGHIDNVGSYAGHIVGAAVQFVGSLSSAAFRGTNEDFLRAVATLFILYVTFKLFRRAFGLIVNVAKLVLVITLLALGYSAYQSGYDKSLEVAQAYGAHAVNHGKDLFHKGRFYQGLFHQHVHSEASKVWELVKEKL